MNQMVTVDYLIIDSLTLRLLHSYTLLTSLHSLTLPHFQCFICLYIYQIVSSLYPHQRRTIKQGFLPSPGPFPPAADIQHCTALYCTVMHCSVLHCTVLYCTVLYCTALHCTLLHCTAPYCTSLYCTALNFISQHSNILNCIVLHCTVLYCIALHCRYSTSMFKYGAKIGREIGSYGLRELGTVY